MLRKSRTSRSQGLAKVNDRDRKMYDKIEKRMKRSQFINEYVNNHVEKAQNLFY